MPYLKLSFQQGAGHYLSLSGKSSQRRRSQEVNDGFSTPVGLKVFFHPTHFKLSIKRFFVGLPKMFEHRTTAITAFRPEDLSSSGRYVRQDLTTSLKQDTRSAHSDVEDGNAINQILAGKVDPAKQALVDSGDITPEVLERRQHQFHRVYIAALKAQHGFELALENALDKSELGKRTRAALKLPEPHLFASDLIAEDLAALGHSPLEATMALPEFSTIPEAIGGLYVRIGSRMGGLIIAKNVRDTLEIDATSGIQFYGLFGKGTQAVFTEFLKGSDEFTQDPDAIKEAVRSANNTFRAVGHWQQDIYKQEIPDIVKAHQAPLLTRAAKKVGRWFVQDN